MIDQGAHTVQHVDPTVTFSVIVYGNADKESYGFAAGMRLARINAVCICVISMSLSICVMGDVTFISRRQLVIGKWL